MADNIELFLHAGLKGVEGQTVTLNPSLSTPETHPPILLLLCTLPHPLCTSRLAPRQPSLPLRQSRIGTYR